MQTDDDRALVQAFRAAYLAEGGTTSPSDARVRVWLEEYDADTVTDAEAAGARVALDECESE